MLPLFEIGRQGNGVLTIEPTESETQLIILRIQGQIIFGIFSRTKLIAQIFQAAIETQTQVGITVFVTFCLQAQRFIGMTGLQPQPKAAAMILRMHKLTGQAYTLRQTIKGVKVDLLIFRLYFINIIDIKGAQIRLTQRKAIA